jgi:hypothetical protein
MLALLPLIFFTISPSFLSFPVTYDSRGCTVARGRDSSPRWALVTHYPYAIRSFVGFYLPVNFSAVMCLVTLNLVFLIRRT